MNNKISQLKSWCFRNKKVSLLLIIVIFGLTYGSIKIFSKSVDSVKYVVSQIETGPIISSVSATGQVSALDQVNINSKVSGDIVSVSALVGQELKSGAIIARIDSSEAYYNFETAKLSYDKLINVDSDSLRNLENKVEIAREDVLNSYISARKDLAIISTNSTNVMDGLYALFNCNTGYLGCNYTVGSREKNLKDKAESSWWTTDKVLKDFLKKYREINNDSTNEEIDNIVRLSRDVALSISETSKLVQDAVVSFRDQEDDNNKSKADEAYSSIASLVSSSNSNLTNSISVYNSLINNNRSLENAIYDLEKLKDGPDILDIRSSQLSLSQKQKILSDYYIRAPFDGIIASLNIKKGDLVNSGTNIATLITKQKIAEITLNEIDIAKVSVGQKVTLSFDAIDDFMATGQVLEVDMLGTVSQGVVNYKVKIGFDTDNEKIKSGMSVSANIITEMVSDVVRIPLNLVKTQSGNKYIEVPSENEKIEENLLNNNSGINLLAGIKRVEVTTGFFNDEYIEILSGIKEGDYYISRVINNASSNTNNRQQTSTPSILGGGAVQGGGRTMIR